MGIAFRTIEKSPDSSAFQNRHALHRHFQHLYDIVFNERQAVEFETLGYAVGSPCLCMEVGKAEQQLASILFPVSAITVGSQHRQVCRQVGYRLGHEVVMLAGMKRHTHIVALAKFARPHATAIDDNIGLDHALVGAHSCHFSAVGQNLFNKRMFEQARAVHARPFRQRLGQVARIGGAIAWHENAAKHPLGIHQGPALGNLCRFHERGLDIEKAREVSLTPEFGKALVVHRNGNRSVLSKPGILACLRFDFLQKLDTIACKRGCGMAALQLANQSCGVPGRSACQLLAFKQDHIAPAGLGEMIGDRTAMDAAANNNGLGVCGQGVGHQWPPPAGCEQERGITCRRLPAAQRRMCLWVRPAVPLHMNCNERCQ